MDETDLKILRLLEKNSRASNTEIAAKIKTSEGTVRKRISDLSEKKIIRRFTIDVGTNTGFNAFVLIKTEPNVILSKTIKKIQLIQGVKKVSEIAGGFDLIVEITTESSEKFNEMIDLIRKIPKIENTQSLIVLKTSF